MSTAKSNFACFSCDPWQAKVQLNLTVCSGAWLMPAKMVINTESTVGYNRLKQAVRGLKLGVNNEVNPDTKKQRFASWQEGHQKLNHQTAILWTWFTKWQQQPLTHKKKRASDFRWNTTNGSRPRSCCSAIRNRQYSCCCWCGRSCDIAVYGMVLESVPLFDVFLKQTGNHR